MTPRLHHEHLVRINDPANTIGAWLTREQLWQGLRHTIVAPQVLDESIESASVSEVTPLRLRREIRRSRSLALDEVELVPNESLRITADASGMFTGSTLTIRIEEPAPEMLFVRFTHEVCGLADARDSEEDNARCSAYRISDIDRIRAARRYAARA
jgi:Domain of unknown function (DUF1857)